MIMASFKALQQKHAWFLPAIIIIAAVLIITGLVATKPTPPKKETKEKEWLVSSEKVSFGLASPQINLLGYVQSPFDSTLSSAIVADVLNVPVRDGQYVKKGDVLISLDAREVELLLAQRKADVSELEALITSELNRYESDKDSLTEDQGLLKIAQQAVARQAKLRASNLVAQERFDNAESQRAQQSLSLNARKLNIADHPSRLNQLKARLLRAKTALNDARIDTERAQITAPFDGVITGVMIAPGERVQIGKELVSLYDRGSMEVRSQVPDRYITLIKSALNNGTDIFAEALSYGEKTKLKLQRLSGQANLKTGGIDAIFTPVVQAHTSAQHDLVLSSSLRIQVDLPALANVITLPLSAIYGTNRVYRIEEGRLHSVNVEILGRQLSSDQKSDDTEPQGDDEEAATQHDRVIIGSKILKEGDTIASTQLPNAISGLKVKVRGLQNEQR
jgi:multidrug efflux pump subunit AcrA (membrane-fusion protein)